MSKDRLLAWRLLAEAYGVPETRMRQLFPFSERQGIEIRAFVILSTHGAPIGIAGGVVTSHFTEFNLGAILKEHRSIAALVTIGRICRSAFDNSNKTAFAFARDNGIQRSTRDFLVPLGVLLNICNIDHDSEPLFFYAQYRIKKPSIYLPRQYSEIFYKPALMAGLLPVNIAGIYPEAFTNVETIASIHVDSRTMRRFIMVDQVGIDIDDILRDFSDDNINIVLISMRDQNIDKAVGILQKIGYVTGGIISVPSLDNSMVVPRFCMQSRIIGRNKIAVFRRYDVTLFLKELCQREMNIEYY